MISCDELHKQLKKADFNPNGWGRTEANELCNILTPDEEVEALVNGWYEAGFALLVATKHRVLLVDKKPLNYLTVEDIRFDMISEFDYSHRLIGAHVSISSGYKTLDFTSLNQRRLRSLLTYVQDRMTEMKIIKHTQRETQREHLEKMNEQLQQYLINANQQLQRQVSEAATHDAEVGSQSTSRQPTVEHETVRQQPVSTTEQLVTSQSSFERAAAMSMGISSPTVQESTDRAVGSVLRRVVVTPQQLGLASIRRVVPIIAAYSRRRQTEDAQPSIAPDPV